MWDIKTRKKKCVPAKKFSGTPVRAVKMLHLSKRAKKRKSFFVVVFWF